MTRVDAHQHFWRLARGDYGWLTADLASIYRDFEPADLGPLLRTAGVDLTVLVQAAPSVPETEFLLDIAARTDFVAGVVGWVDMESADAAETTARLAGNRWLKGLRPMMQDIADDRWMLKAELDPALAALTAHGLVFDALVKPGQLVHLPKFVARHPDMTVVIDHGAKPDIATWRIGDKSFSRWAAVMTTLAQSPRTWCKLSGLVTEAGTNWQADDLRPYVETILAAFGPKRVIWGSDWPVVTLVCGYDRWRSCALALLADVDEAGCQAIFGGNAMRCYGLSDG